MSKIYKLELSLEQAEQLDRAMSYAVKHGVNSKAFKELQTEIERQFEAQDN